MAEIIAIVSGKGGVGKSTTTANLGTALANISAIVDPEVFVIGGGVSKAGDVLLDYIKKYYVPTAFHGCRETRFELAKLGNDAGIYGTARLILDK